MTSKKFSCFFYSFLLSILFIESAESALVQIRTSDCENLQTKHGTKISAILNFETIQDWYNNYSVIKACWSDMLTKKTYIWVAACPMVDRESCPPEFNKIYVLWPDRTLEYEKNCEINEEPSDYNIEKYCLR